MNNNTNNTHPPGVLALRDVASGLHVSLISLGFVFMATTGFVHHDLSLPTATETHKLAGETGYPRPASTEDSWRLAAYPVLDKVDHLEFGSKLKPTQISKGQGLKAGQSALVLSDEMERVKDWVAKRYRVSGRMLEPVLIAVEEHAVEAGLDPLLIVAVMAIESSFDPKAESHAGAQGLMQVIPRWHMDKIGEDAPDDALFDPVINVRVGTEVLVEGLQRFGSLQEALQYYNGARNDPNARYTKRVLAMKEQLVQVARTDDEA